MTEFACTARLGYDRGLPCVRTTPHEPHKGCIYIASAAEGRLVDVDHPHLPEVE